LADDLVDLGLHQLGQHAEPNTNRQRQQPFLGCAGQLAQRLLHPLGQLLEAVVLADRVGVLLYGPHGGSSCPRWTCSRSPRSRSDRTRREDRHLQSSTSYGSAPSSLELVDEMT